MSEFRLDGSILNQHLSREVQILLVEDSPSDVAMTVSALRDGRIANHVHVVRDGEEAMAFLRHQDPYGQAVRPDVVMLDLNLPRMDGREVLRELKADDDLKAIPVIVLTTSANDADVLTSYRLAANSYVVKPVDYDAFLDAIRGIEDFWLEVVRLPQDSELELQQWPAP